MHSYYILCAFAISLMISSSFCQLQIGSGCYHSAMKQSGTCVPMNECTPAVVQLKSFHIHPERCGPFVGIVPIVCCTDSTGSTARKYCEKYSELTYKWETPVVMLPHSQPILKSVCTFKAQTLVIGGEEAFPKEFPHMALIGYTENASPSSGLKWKCGGSLISDQFILTAAHCLTPKQMGHPKRVVLGERDLRDKDENHENFGIAKLHIHPDYKPPARYNDIGLIELDRKVNFDEFIRPACLNTDRYLKVERAIATGWGEWEPPGQTSRIMSDVLMKVTLGIYSVDYCNNAYKHIRSGKSLISGILDESQICAGSKTNKKDTCYGDSGGPLQVYNKDVQCMYDIIGVVSFGVDCARHFPGVYTRVSHYVSWIEDIVWLKKAENTGYSHLFDDEL